MQMYDRLEIKDTPCRATSGNPNGRLGFIFMSYPWYWVKRKYKNKHFRQFQVICMVCLLAVSVFLTIFLAYDNAQSRRCYFHPSIA